MTTASAYEPRALLGHVRHRIVGMAREVELVAVALSAGRHVLLEGPPGTGKSTLLRSLASGAGVALRFVEGNAELTPSRLVGHHDPALVLAGGYREEAFVPGPLADAVRNGALLYVEELNRVPEETLNVLITALAEGELHVPRYGTITASPNFRLIAAMNPFDAIGTSRIGQAIYDRLCRVSIDYQDEVEERAIVASVTGQAYNSDDVEIAVAVSRGTRSHRDLRFGSSVRGAIDMTLLAQGLRSTRPFAHEKAPEKLRELYVDAALTALSGRVRVDEACDRSPESIVTEILDGVLAERSRRDGEPTEPSEDDPGKGERPGQTPPGGGQGRILEGDEAKQAVQEASRRTTGRRELSQKHGQRFEDVSPELGGLDEEALDALAADDPDAAAELLADLANATDASLRAKARRAATRVFVRLASTGTPPVRGVRRRVRSLDPLVGELDLDATLARTDGLAPREADDLVTRRWGARQRAVVLLVDRSGSMSGHQVATAAVGATSVLLAGAEQTEVSVIAFARDSIVLSAIGRPRPVDAVVGDVLALRGKGVTNLALALRAARRQLGISAASDRCVIVLSDSMSNEGDDPYLALRGIERLHVVGTSDEEESVEAGQRLARLGGGLHRVCTSVADLPGVLSDLLAAHAG